MKLKHTDKTIRTVALFNRPDNSRALAWRKKIQAWLKKNYPVLKIVEKKPQSLIALGGDGAILHAARKYQKDNPLILGLNLGQVGFLASIREPENFLKGLEKFFNGDYRVSERIMLGATVIRKNKTVFKAEALNDVVIQNLLGVSEIELNIEHESIQHIRGTGLLVSTPTGSTAYNLSAHGPIVMPSIKCLIVSELLDHNIPTPSIVLNDDEKITLRILDFRERGLLSLRKSGKPIDMILSADGENIFPLKTGDRILIRRSPHLVKFAELEKNYFFKSLKEKFAFK